MLFDHSVFVAVNGTGTLNGTDPSDPIVSVGDKDVFECDLLPPGSASSLRGEWRAYVDGMAANIVSINETGGRALVLPPSPPGHYGTSGSVVIRCVLATPEGDPLFESNHTVHVKGKLCILMDTISIIYAVDFSSSNISI